MPLETSSLIYTEAALTCLRCRIRIRAVLLGVVIGLGVAGVFVLWTNKGVHMKKPVMRDNAGERMQFTYNKGTYLDIAEKDQFCKRGGKRLIY